MSSSNRPAEETKPSIHPAPPGGPSLAAEEDKKQSINSPPPSAAPRDSGRGLFNLFRSPSVIDQKQVVPPASHSASYDHLFKILLVGDLSADKSGFLLRFSDDSFTTSFITTIGVDYKIKTMELDGKRIKLQMWDTCGQERFRTITTAYYKGAQGIMLMYNATDLQSFNNIRNWLNHIKQHAADNTVIHLIATGCEYEDRVVTTKMGQELASELGMQFFECAIKNNVNITESFVSLTRAIREQQAAALAPAAPASKPGKCIII